MDKIILKGMSFFAYHGVLESEKNEGQEFIIDVHIVTDLAAAASSDDLKQTVDYDLVYRRIGDAVTGDRYDLLETLAEKVAEVALDHELVTETTVIVKKPRPPIEGNLQWAGVKITRSK